MEMTKDKEICALVIRVDNTIAIQSIDSDGLICDFCCDNIHCSLYVDLTKHFNQINVFKKNKARE